jgi:hypothetical protein
MAQRGRRFGKLYGIGNLSQRHASFYIGEAFLHAPEQS